MLIADQDWGVPPIAFADAMLDPSGRLKIARGQNVYDVDFEYGMQPLRWENFTAGTATIAHQPQAGGVLMRVAANGDLAMRQSKPYFRYQPSKGIYASAAVLFGAPTANVIRRVGMFDSDNGVFFEQDSTGLWAVRRANTGNGVVDTRIAQADWTLDRLNGTGRSGRALDFSRIQMAVMDYAWYGAGRARLGFIVAGKLLWCHAFDSANVAGQILPWSRTGNLPCRYEIRRTGTPNTNADFWHWGVSVVVEGGFDEQRGFTFPHANATRVAVTTRRPILSSRLRSMAVIDEGNTATAGAVGSLTRTGAGWTNNQFRGRYLLLTGGTGAGQMARIVSNTATVLTCDNPLTLSASPFGTAPAAGTTYQIGVANRGQLVPQQLIISSDAGGFFELVLNGTPATPSWTDLGGASLSQQDTAAATITGGQVVFSCYTPAGGQGVQAFDLRQIQALGTSILGNTPDTLSLVATSFTGTANVAASILYTEAMS
ncbi:hypothetical protein [Falsiroseomonas ponticola]|uniref:hypothetical protein n=1 Tax=Falsiroseomonas ponticola TaxID=2786951 RepID=UPI0019319588|nr:hypothetical protein [Roseomonas ponticola]